MKYIQHQNIQKLLFIIQKICFYSLYKDEEFNFSFEIGDLFYTNVIEIHRNNKIEYISLLKKPEENIKKILPQKDTIIYYKNNRKSKSFQSQKIKSDFNGIYEDFIRYVFDHQIDDHSKLKDIIKEGELVLENESYHQTIKEIQNLLNNADEEKQPDNEGTPKSTNPQKRHSSHTTQLQNIIQKCLKNDESKDIHIFWLFYYGLYIEDKLLEKKFPKCYKYYNFNNPNYLNGRMNGEIHFAHPESFNDPFDVNCFTDPKTNIIDNNSPSRDLFRVFCSTNQYDNLLMWAHYGYNHTGYCVEYSTNSIITNMNNLPYNLIIVGEVIYTEVRNKLPPLKSGVLPIYNFKDYIEAAFWKDNKWEYEHEFRFVIVDFKGFQKLPPVPKNSGITVTGDIKKVYLGVSIEVNNMSTLINTLNQNNQNNIIHYSLKLSDDGYEVEV